MILRFFIEEMPPQTTERDKTNIPVLELRTRTEEERGILHMI